MVGNFCTVIQFIGHLLMALNRFTLIWIPLKHENIWHKQWYTVIILISSLLSISRRVGESSKFVFGEDSTVSVTFADKNVTTWNNLQSTIINFSTTVFAAILNVLAFVKLLLRKQNNAAINVNEKNLLYVSIIIFITQVLRLLYNVIGLLFPSNISLIAFFNAALPILTDISIWSGSISLIVLSGTVRQKYIQFYFGKTINNAILVSPTQTAVVAPNNRFC